MKKAKPEANPFSALVEDVEEYATNLSLSGVDIEDADVDVWELADMIRGCGWDAEEVLELDDLRVTDTGDAQLDAAALTLAKGDKELATWIVHCAFAALSGARYYWAENEAEDED